MILDDTAGAEVVAMKIQVLDSMVAAQGAVGVVQHTRFLDNTAAAAAEAGRSKVAGVLVVHLLQDRDGGGGRRGTPSSLFFFFLLIISSFLHTCVPTWMGYYDKRSVFGNLLNFNLQGNP